MCNMALTHRPLCYYNATEFSVIEIKFRLLNWAEYCVTGEDQGPTSTHDPLNSNALGLSLIDASQGHRHNRY